MPTDLITSQYLIFCTSSFGSIVPTLNCHWLQ
ncbi:hypothetical protein GGE65_005977 [Skermanella aerolata]